MRNTCARAFAALCFSFLPCLVAKVISVRGELTCDSCSYYTDYLVELQEVNAHSPSTLVPVRASGDFEVQVPDGTYMVTVSDNGRVLKSEVVSINEFSNRLSIRLPKDRTQPKAATGIVSAARLKNKVPKQALKEYKKAHSLFESGDIDGSLDHLKRATDLDPDYMEAWNNLGCRFMMKHRPQDALTAFQRALAIDRQAPLVHTNLGIALMMLGRADEAERAARKGMAIDPADRKARYVLGFSLYIQHRYTDESVKLLREAAEAMPKARVALAHTLSLRGQPGAARTILSNHLSSGQSEGRQEAQKLLNSLE